MNVSPPTAFAVPEQIQASVHFPILHAARMLQRAKANSAYRSLLQSQAGFPFWVVQEGLVNLPFAEAARVVVASAKNKAIEVQFLAFLEPDFVPKFGMVACPNSCIKEQKLLLLSELVLANSTQSAAQVEPLILGWAARELEPSPSREFQQIEAIIRLL